MRVPNFNELRAGLRRLITASLLGALASLPAVALVYAEDIPPAATIAATDTYVLHSANTGQDYKILVARPPDRVHGDSKELAVAYLLDADELFGLATDTAGRLTDGGELPPLLWVGITYAAGGNVERRSLDFTPWVDRPYERLVSELLRPEHSVTTGGAASFLRFIREELKPFIAAHYPVNPADATLVGHSLAGSFGLYVLLHQPDTFARYIIGSPCLLCGEGDLFSRESAFAATHPALAARLYMDVGDKETDLRHILNLPPSMREAERRYLDAVGHPDTVALFRRFRARLQSHHYAGLHVSAVVERGESHESLPAIMLTRGLRFAYAAQAGANDVTALRRISEQYFDWRTRNDSLSYPPLDTIARLSRLPAMPDISLSHAVRNASQARIWLRELAALAADALSHEDQLTLAILRWDLQNYLEAPRYYWLDFPISVYGTRLQPIHDILAGYVFHDQSDLDHYLALIREYPALIDAMTAKLRGQLSRSIVMPAAELELARRFIDSLMVPAPQAVWYVKPERLTDLPDVRGKRFERELSLLIERAIDPSLQRMLTFLDGEYARKAPSAVGLGQYPGGSNFYRWLVRFHTTQEVSPEEVHRLGLAEIARLEAPLAQVAAELGIQGGMSGLRERVQNDSQFHARDAAEVGTRLMAYLHRIEPVIPQYFSTTPRTPYIVRRLPAEHEGGLTFGYYQDPTPGTPAGVYWYNGSSLEQRSMLMAGALIYHELLPGHHMQHALQAENPTLPAFRRYGGYNAFDEGWATYASSVAGDMGMYLNPYDRWGEIANEMMVATRLVVDTGMNALGWSRERASRYLTDHTFSSASEIATETLRYSCDIPGQALAYATGSLKLRALRKRERETLGERFDIRRFHDAVLVSGAMPMEVLDSHVSWFDAH
jgi:uncharacterized protein (DUF885 family)/predicted alpha/beta superfamily hydrolase